MTTVSLAKSVVGLTVVAAAILAGCSDRFSALSATPQGDKVTGSQRERVTRMLAHTMAHFEAPLLYENHVKSSMNPDAKGKPQLLYVSDQGNDTIEVYDYKTGVMEGTLTNVDLPFGQCVDKAGNVYIALFGDSLVVEYAHGGSSQIKTLVDYYGTPIGCSVDPTTGNLAVSNYANQNGHASVLVYPAASGTATSYTSTKFPYWWPPAYDNKGNLYIEGETASGTYGAAVLSKGDSRLKTLSLPYTIHFSAGAVWDGKYVGLTDQEFNGNYTTIYQTRFSGTTGTEVGSTGLADTCDGYGSGASGVDVIEPYIAINTANKRRKTVIGGNVWCRARFDFWKYPAGGNPAKALGSDGPAWPFGQSVSTSVSTSK
jgi:hypothetical protein